MQKERIVGASILPLCRDNSYQNIYIYLGKERRSSHWSDSETWSDFGGSVKWEKKDVLQEEPESCAAREAWEETTCIMKFNSNDSLPLMNYEGIYQKLKKKDYIMKVSVSQPDGSVYITYVVEVPFDPDIPKRFITWQKNIKSASYYERAHDDQGKIFTRLMHVNTHPALRPNARVSHEFMEKSNIQLFSIPNIVSAIENNGSILWRYGKSEYLRDSFYKRIVMILENMKIRFLNPFSDHILLKKIDIYPIESEDGT